jgi:hypothetical protein
VFEISTLREYVGIRESKSKRKRKRKRKRKENGESYMMKNLKMHEHLLTLQWL